MSVKLSDLCAKLGVPKEELIKKLADLGYTVKPQAKTISEEAARRAEEDFAAPKESKTAVYEELIEKELDKEIIKSQRKMTAGKDAKTQKTVQKHAPPAQTPAPVQKTVQAGQAVEIPDSISVKEFSEKTGLNPVKIIGELMKNGILANINQTIDFETATIIADDFGIKLKRKRSEATIEDISTGNLEILLKEKDEKDLTVRPPIVTVMGHVDHGKTKLLDAIRETDVVSTEAGGITQHIGAYQVEKNGRKITFIDTPGHEAFASMRARGARITDIAILVVAADEGVKPQTIEALNHAKEAGVPIIAAINKIDKEDINIDRVKAQLAEQGLQPEDWGGKTIMAPVSAVTGQGIPLLLEMILLVADMENLRANPNRPAVATVVEAHLDKNLGPVATVLINTGTLRIYDAVVAGDIWGRVKTMKNHLGADMKFAGPSIPARISGLSNVPNVGDVMQVVKNVEEARSKSEKIQLMRNAQEKSSVRSLEQIMSAIQEGKMKTLKVVAKADTFGTMEALKHSIAQVKHQDTSVKIIHAAVGDISESDVMMAAASRGIVVGFNASATVHVRQIAEKEGVQIFFYDIIYKLLDDLKKILEGLMEPEVVQTTLGKAEVRAVFLTEKKHMIVGCRVMEGLIENKSRIRVFRNNQMIGEGALASLKKINDAVHQATEGNECGIKFEGGVKLEAGDILESWKEERKTKVIA